MMPHLLTLLFWLVVCSSLVLELGCANPIAGHQYTGVDVGANYTRFDSNATVVQSTRWPPSVTGIPTTGNSYGFGVVMHFEYKPPPPAAPSVCCAGRPKD